jgi:penicillin-binding protein 1C
VASARDALVQSLNIPAVRLLNAYGVFQFYSFLKAAGVSTLFRTADDYGLPLILGGSEVTMWDMSVLYRGLANEGIFRNNYVVDFEKTNETAQLISAGSCYLTLEMIKDLKRPGSEYFWERFSGSQPFAWKTGTSYGHKDAWAVGVNPEYTIAVWVGNFDGESNKNLSGATSAGPILFDVLQVLPQDNPKQWFTKNDMDYRQLRICKLSGFRATDACSDVDTVDVPYGMKPLQACDYHQFRYFSTNGKYQSCSKCWNSIGGVKKSVVMYPPDIAYYLRQKGQYIETIASHYPNCPGYKSEQSLKIIYPNMDAKLFIPRDFDGQTQSVICRVGHSGIGKIVYWYLDDHYLGATNEEHKMAITFKEGWNTLKVIDEYGAEDLQRVFATHNK